jgi:hypothetical protein
MISLDKAFELKKAGLKWQPALNDFFAIPERDMDEKIFVISDMLVTIDFLQGIQVVSFQGASEWALDSLVTDETVWLPRDEQLLHAIEAAMLERGAYNIQLRSILKGYECEIQFEGEKKLFKGRQVSSVYADALLYLFRSQS